MIKNYIVLILFILTTACSIEPQEINYGKDECSNCKMLISDKQHAAQVISKNDKVYKYDAIECMMRHNEGLHDKVSLFFVNDYNKPGILINAKDATYLISKNLPSPMGENLNAFATKKEAETTFRQNGGDFYSWDELVELYIDKAPVNLNEAEQEMKCEPGKCAPGKCG